MTVGDEYFVNPTAMDVCVCDFFVFASIVALGLK